MFAEQVDARLRAARRETTLHRLSNFCSFVSCHPDWNYWFRPFFSLVFSLVMNLQELLGQEHLAAVSDCDCLWVEPIASVSSVSREATH